MAKLFVVQDRYNEDITEWHIYTNKAKAEAKYKELESEYEEEWQVELKRTSSPNSGFLIGFDDNLGEVFADVIEDVSNYELESYYKNTTAYLIGPKSKEGKIVVGSYGDLDLTGNLEELAYWEQSKLISSKRTGKSVNAPTKSKSKPSNYDKALKVANVMRSEWEKVKPEDKGVNSVEGLPLKTVFSFNDKFILRDFEAKAVWFANILNTALFKCNLNTKYSNTEYFKVLKNEGSIFRLHRHLSTTTGDSLYFEWPENITKEVNKIVSAAGKDQEIMVKALYLFIRDYLNKLPSSETTGKSTSTKGLEVEFTFDDFDAIIAVFAHDILGQINDPDIEVLKKPNVFNATVDWASGFPAFESVQPVKQLKHVQLFEGFVNTLKEKQ